MFLTLSVRQGNFRKRSQIFENWHQITTSCTGGKYINLTLHFHLHGAEVWRAGIYFILFYFIDLNHSGIICLLWGNQICRNLATWHNCDFIISQMIRKDNRKRKVKLKLYCFMTESWHLFPVLTHASSVHVHQSCLILFCFSRFFRTFVSDVCWQCSCMVMVK